MAGCIPRCHAARALRERRRRRAGIADEADAVLRSAGRLGRREARVSLLFRTKRTLETKGVDDPLPD